MNDTQQIQSDRLDEILYGFSTTIKPEQKLPITTWAKRYVNLSRSSRSEKADLEQTPWLIRPLEEILGNRAEEIVILAPTGGGKSTMMEVATTYIVAERPGPMLICAQSDPDANEWFQTGIKPALQKCELIADLWPTKKSNLRKDFIAFPHMTLFCGGANHNNLQSKSCDYVFLDEAWCYKQGLLSEARRRTHDRFNSKVVICSQAGTVEDDLNAAWNACYKHEYAFKCKGCQTDVVYNFDHIKFDCDKVGEEYVWDSLIAWYECPHCNARYEDTVNDRREQCSSGGYIQHGNDNPLHGHIGYHFSALNVWWISWSKIVIEFLKAKQSIRVGNLNPLRQFNQKRLAQAWADYSVSEDEQLKIGEYLKSDIQYWDTTILTADVQKHDIWYVVRTWSKSGQSRLIEAHKVLHWHELEGIQKKHNIKSNCVFLDSAYRTEEVKGVLAKYGWLGLNGRPDAYYDVKNSKTGKKYKRIFSTPNRHKTSYGEAIITYYSSKSVKDILFILKCGHGAEWGIPRDIEKEYVNQLESEIKIIGADGKPTYKQTKAANHFLDCEAEQIAAATMHGCYPTVIPDGDDS